MAIEVEFHQIPLTGMIGPGLNDTIILQHAPSTGPNGEWDIAVDPIDGPAQRLAFEGCFGDFGVTHMDWSSGGQTGVLTFGVTGSDVADVVNNYQAHGVTGVLTLRVLYNYAT